MKMMKKFSLLVAIALLITVGGVYAQWTYAQGAIEGVSTANLAPKLSGYASTTEKGTIKVDTTGITKLMVDDLPPSEGAAQDHIADFVVEGKVVVTFTPSAGADDTIKTNGIKMKYSFAIIYNDGVTEDLWQFADSADNNTLKPIFVVDTQEVNANGGNATLSFEIDAAELMSKIQLGGTFKLDTVKDYEDFNAIIGKAQIQIRVSEVVTTPDPVEP